LLLLGAGAATAYVFYRHQTAVPPQTLTEEERRQLETLRGEAP
jgi:hypothetical protein